MSLVSLQLGERVIVLFHNMVKINNLLDLLLKEREKKGFWLRPMFQSFRNFWTILANNEEQQQKRSWKWWSALANDIYYLTNNLTNSWCKCQGSFLGLLKHYIICPAKINEWVCKDLDSHKGEHCQQEYIKCPGSNLQFTPFWLD